jgi:hypothetical protein
LKIPLIVLKILPDIRYSDTLVIAPVCGDSFSTSISAKWAALYSVEQ